MYAQTHNMGIAAKMKGAAMSTLRVLTDNLGARVTGSVQSKKISAYLLKKIKGTWV